MAQAAFNLSLKPVKFCTLKIASGIRRPSKITFKFLNRICLLRGWGSQGKFVKDRQTFDDNLL